MTDLTAPSLMARDRSEDSGALYASMALALSLGAIWDLAARHAVAFDHMLADPLDADKPHRDRPL